MLSKRCNDNDLLHYSHVDSAKKLNILENVRLKKVLSDLEHCKRVSRYQHHTTHYKLQQETKEFESRHPDQSESNFLIYKQKISNDLLLLKCRQWTEKIQQENKDSKLNKLEQLGKQYHVNKNTNYNSDSEEHPHIPEHAWMSDNSPPDMCRSSMDGVYYHNARRRVTFSNIHNPTIHDAEDTDANSISNNLTNFSLFARRISRRKSAPDVFNFTKEKHSRSGSLSSSLLLSRRGSGQGQSESSFGRSVDSHGVSIGESQVVTKNSESRLKSRRSKNANMLNNMGRTVSEETRRQILTLDILNKK